MWDIIFISEGYFRYLGDFFGTFSYPIRFHPISALFFFQGEPSEGTSIEFVGQLLEHPIAKQLMVQERLVELAKKGTQYERCFPRR